MVPLTSARTAVTPSSVLTSVLFVVGMAVRAMSPSRLTGRYALSSPNVLRLRNRLQVGGIHTRSIPTQMVDNESSRDSAVDEPVRHLMRATVLFRGQLEVRVPVAVDSRCPHEAIAYWASLRPKPLFDRQQEFWTEVRDRVSMSAPAVVVHLAPPPGCITPRFIAIGNSAGGGCLAHAGSVSHLRRVQSSL